MLKALPLFPLPLIKLPGELLELHIFEPRYRKLLEDLKTGEQPLIGIPCTIDEAPQTGQLGCLARLKSILKIHPDGRADIYLEVVDLFQLAQYEPKWQDKPYPGGQVQVLNAQNLRIEDHWLIQQLRLLKAQYPLALPLTIKKDMGEFDLLAQLPIQDIAKLNYLQLPPNSPARKALLRYEVKQLGLLLMQQKAVYKGFCFN
ncbi:LON peptidase substrate-binding domain-containing protein [Saprospira sp. CCB-QB6]|uniref:LON peptidase substrate-binding domain-containing protein n=1 Tax=Saprospira sp. CCB-QB6 TaxID=3023936 RepID=UPI00234B30E1|nr:LON peptidase substrate-binding domain-containing protein [Saprospira sp. CCB-QB6]WCL82712.1 LON peptidase substrate-binding domain-containing protein [Saprospira sp. CCB-QB6]